MSRLWALLPILIPGSMGLSRLVFFLPLLWEPPPGWQQ